MEGSVSDYYTITALDVTPDDSKSNSFAFARWQHVIDGSSIRHGHLAVIDPKFLIPRY